MLAIVCFTFWWGDVLKNCFTSDALTQETQEITQLSEALPQETQDSKEQSSEPMRRDKLQIRRPCAS